MEKGPRLHPASGGDDRVTDEKTPHLHYRALMETSKTIMMLLDANHIVQEINIGGRHWLNLTYEQALGQPFEELISLVDATCFRHHFASVWATGLPCHLKIQILGSPHNRCLEAELVPIKINGADEPIALWLIGQEISQQIEEKETPQQTKQQQTEQQLKRALQDKDIMLQELHHRIKNSLQVVSAILSLQARFVTDHDMVEILHDSRSRIHAIAMIHETLYRSPNGLEEVNFTAYLKRLVKASIFAHTQRSLSITTRFDLDTISLGIETALPCGLIVNEILMNALQHAFPDQENGTITITLKHVPAQGYRQKPLPQSVLEYPDTEYPDTEYPNIEHLDLKYHGHPPDIVPSSDVDQTSVSVNPQNSSFEHDSPREMSSSTSNVTNHQYHLSICDDGVGFPEASDPSKMESIGMSLVQDLTYQLGGEYKIKQHGKEKGTCFQLIFSPLHYRKKM